MLRGFTGTPFYAYADSPETVGNFRLGVKWNREPVFFLSILKSLDCSTGIKFHSLTAALKSIKQ